MCHLVHFHLDCALFTSCSRPTPTLSSVHYFSIFFNDGSLEEKKQDNDFGRGKKTDNMVRGVQRAFGVAEILAKNGCKNIRK